MYENFTEMSLTFKCSMMVNNLNFMIPENFIDDMHIFIKAKVYVRFNLGLLIFLILFFVVFVWVNGICDLISFHNSIIP